MRRAYDAGMDGRDLANRIGVVAVIVIGLALAATLTGRPDFSWPLVALTYWLSLLLVIRPAVYERFDTWTGDWIILILVFGPFAFLAAPFMFWQHRGSDSD
jgi:hypothetical protein